MAIIIAVMLAIGSAAAVERTGAPGALDGWCTPESVRLAIEDLQARHGDRFPAGVTFIERLAALDITMPQRGRGLDAYPTPPAALLSLLWDVVLADPDLDFERLLVLRRRAKSKKDKRATGTTAGRRLGMPQNWQGNSSLAKGPWDNELAVVSWRDGRIGTVYRPDGRAFIGDVDLHWDAERLLFSTQDAAGTWMVCEVGIDGTGLRRVSPDMGADVDAYDAIYLPDDRIPMRDHRSVPTVSGLTKPRRPCRSSTCIADPVCVGYHGGRSRPCASFSLGVRAVPGL